MNNKSPRSWGPLLPAIIGALIAGLAGLGGVWLANNNANADRISSIRKDAYEGFIVSMDDLATRIDDIAGRARDDDSQAVLSMITDLEKVAVPAFLRAATVVEIEGSEQAGALSTEMISKFSVLLGVVPVGPTDPGYLSALDQFNGARSAFVSLVRKELRS